jgi:hypothetical protein
MMNLCQEVLIAQQRKQDVIEVDRKDVEEPAGSGRVDGVTGMIRCSPRIRPIR